MNYVALAAILKAAEWWRTMLTRMQLTPEVARRFALEPYVLTPREIIVLGLLLGDHTNKEVAAILGSSYRTIEVHRARILAKTGAVGLISVAKLAMDLESEALQDIATDYGVARKAAPATDKRDAEVGAAKLVAMSAEIVSNIVARNEVADSFALVDHARSRRGRCPPGLHVVVRHIERDAPALTVGPLSAGLIP